MKQLKVGIIGQGRSGRDIHGKCLVNMPEKYKIVAVTDALESRRERAKAEYGCNVYADYHDMIANEELDIVVNSTFSHMHIPVTIDLLKNGQNVLCEKPFARKASDVDEAIKVAEETGKKLFVFQQSRFAPYFQKVKEIINSGDIGRVVQISVAFNGFARRWDWQTIQDYMAGNLLNTGPHPMDQVLDLYGGDVNDMPEIMCIMDRANTFGDAEDYVKILMRGEGHPVIDVEISSCCAYPSFTYNVQGTRGGIKASQQKVEWKFFKEEECQPQQLIKEPLCKEDGTPAYCGEKITWYENSWDAEKDPAPATAAYSNAGVGNLFNTIAARYYEGMYEALVNDADFEVKLWQVRRQVAVIEECHRQNPLSKSVK